MTQKTPTALRVVNGNRSKRPMPKHEAAPAAAKSLEPPRWLSVDARRAWRKIARPLAACGLLSSVDLPALACLADAMGDLARVSRLLQTRAVDGLITTIAGNVIQDPLIGQKRRARADVARLAAMFGATPVSRAGLEILLPSALPRPPTGKPPLDTNRFFGR